ncbi:hypothetical protein NDU88_002744 [Pleurodeles waltl]|uniref:Uncharacterized protein n=1 Tax=Pleurodeles waltl TaxID=8319 RepID=A0AAV7M2G4_PLEWA|nr:hypothetical protein NDU88_002744 [Pleurodeles waltl]
MPPEAPQLRCRAAMRRRAKKGGNGPPLRSDFFGLGTHHSGAQSVSVAPGAPTVGRVRCFLVLGLPQGTPGAVVVGPTAPQNQVARTIRQRHPAQPLHISGSTGTRSGPSRQALPLVRRLNRSARLHPGGELSCVRLSLILSDPSFGPARFSTGFRLVSADPASLTVPAPVRLGPILELDFLQLFSSQSSSGYRPPEGHLICLFGVERLGLLGR